MCACECETASDDDHVSESPESLRPERRILNPGALCLNGAEIAFFSLITRCSSISLDRALYQICGFMDFLLVHFALHLKKYSNRKFKQFA